MLQCVKFAPPLIAREVPAMLIQLLQRVTMTHRIHAIFEKGVFRPVQPVNLDEGSRVEIEFETVTPPPDPKELLKALDAIAALPCEGPDDGFSGADHDSVLYGKDGAW